MRIKKLEIHNIASIEDAVIDFDQQPLSDTDLFLITGTTGAGKTTLLDAICLALYSTTPRIIKGESGTQQANSDNLTGRDPRNAMRQNTGYAYSKLLFTGNDGKDYLAEWSVERGSKRKASSNLSNAVWSILELSSGKCTKGSTRNSNTEVAEIIKDAVGLDFEQFCRTTMLAQGEFTEFLKSDEEHKAEILEKISGSEIYRKIGAEIYNQYLDAKKRYDAEEQKHSQIVVLPPEERLEKENELKAINLRVNEYQEKSQRLQTLINWINAREEKKRKSEAASRAILNLEQDFREALSGEAYLLQWHKSQEAELDSLKQMIESQKDKHSAYSNSQTIVAKLRSMMESSSELKTKQGLQEKYSSEIIPKAKELQEKSKAEYEAREQEYQKQQAGLSAVEAELQEMNLSELRKEKDFLTKLGHIKDQSSSQEAKLIETESLLNEKKIEIVTLKSVVASESKELERLSLEHERRKQSIGELVKQMRSMLGAHLGEEDNFCPVCGQLVSTIKTDAIFDEEYQKIQLEFNTQKEKERSANNAVIAHEKQIELLEKQRQEITAAILSFKEELAQLSQGHSAADALAEYTKGFILEKIESLNMRISEGEKIEQQRSLKQAELKKALEAKSEANTKMVSDSASLEQAENKLKDFKEDIQQILGKLELLRKEINSSLQGSMGWKYDWLSETESFVEELGVKTQEYKNMLDTIEQIKLHLSKAEPVIENIMISKEEILKHMPGWRETEVMAEKKQGLQEMWSSLSLSLNSQIQTKSDAEAELAKLSDQIKESVGEEIEIESLNSEKKACDEQRDSLNVRKGVLSTEIRSDDEAIMLKGDTTLLDQLRAEYERWRSFNAKYGDKEGNTLSKIAQSYVLGSLLNAANQHLNNMAPRYRLLVNPGTLNLKLEDKYNGFATRSTNSISGGESFLVSLALALALADFGQHLGVSTLFIDEGFGTLSGEALQSAINTLKTLHSDAGRQVGIISHREEIRENIPTQIMVNLTPGGSASTVEVVG